MENKQIDIVGEIYQAVPETNVCEGCAFYHDEGEDYTKCAMAVDIFDCIDNKVIWKKVGGKTGAAVKQVGGSHYQKAIQPWDIIHEWKLDYWRGNVIKYVLRCNEKNGIEDLKKAIHYLEYAIENYEEDIK
jgi:hypothetical protein